MHKGTMTFLFDSGQLWRESWEFYSSSPEDALRRWSRVAQARIGLLAASVRIIEVKVNGQPLQKVRWRGTGGAWAWPREFLVLRHDHMATQKRLRGVPREICGASGITARGLSACRDWSRVLNECGCVIVTGGGQAQAVTDLQPVHLSLFSWKKDKKATKRMLLRLLGKEEGQQFWSELKAKTKPQQPVR